MAPPIIWLPPLSDRDESFRIESSRIKVHAQELSKVEDIHEGRKISIVVNVRVAFYTETRPIRGLIGLYLKRRDLIEVAEAGSMAASLRRKFLDDNYLIPFPLHSIFYVEKHYGSSPSLELQLSSDDDVAGRISRFLLLLHENRRGKMVQVAIDINKYVILSEDELEAWTSWYKEQGQIHANFREEYRRAVTQDCSQTTCAICLEDCDRSTGVCQLSCRHRFHKKCILTWFKRELVCPVCRNLVKL